EVIRPKPSALFQPPLRPSGRCDKSPRRRQSSAGGLKPSEGFFIASSHRRAHAARKLLLTRRASRTFVFGVPMSRRVGIVVLVGVLLTGAARVVLADGGAGEREKENAARALRDYAARYVSAVAHLTPTYARQTGLACSACHTHFPELTPTGRAFKLNGYVFRRSESLEGKTPEGQQSLLLNLVAPVSLMFQTSYTSTKKALPSTQNGTVLFPDQLSLFTGGEITPHVGGFLQVTFDPQSGQLGVDNADFRFATHGTLLSKRATFGLSVNNNPTVQDIWNSTPAWGFPYGSSAVAPAPGAATLIDGTLGQQVAGLTAYTMWNDRVYGDFRADQSIHRSGGGPRIHALVRVKQLHARRHVDPREADLDRGGRGEPHEHPAHVPHGRHVSHRYPLRVHAGAVRHDRHERHAALR